MVNGKHGISWDQVLQNRASELVVAIQNANPADNLENLSETNMTSGSDSNSSDDVQWMETVLISEFMFFKGEYKNTCFNR